MLGGYVTNLTLKDSYIHDSENHGFAFTDQSDDLGTDLGGYDGGSYRTWKLLKNRFEDNFTTYSASSLGHVFMNTSGGITDLVIERNYFGGIATTTYIDYIGVNLYNSIGTKIIDNYFGENIEAMSFGKSQAANYHKINPMQYADVSLNTFHKSSNIFDNDAAIGVNMHHNQFIETWASVFGTYSQHFPAIISHDIIRNANQRADQFNTYDCNGASAFCINGNEGIVIENNTIIDDRKLRDPSEAPTLSETAGGSMGARTYYVKYTWLNVNGEETLASPEASVSVTANNLLTVSLPNGINTTWKHGTGPGPGVRTQRIYVGTASEGETAQWDIAQHTQDFTWTEPTTGLISGAALPSANNTKSRMYAGINELNGNGDGTLPNIYRNNQIIGATSTAIKLVTTSSSISTGNIYNLNSDTGNDDINYELLPTIASSTQPILNIQATSTSFLAKLINYGLGGFLQILDRLGNTIFTILDNGNVGVATSTPGSILSVQGVGNFQTPTSTMYTGLNLTSGCYAINGICISSTSGAGSPYPFTPLTIGSLTYQATNSPMRFDAGMIAYGSSTVGGQLNANTLTVGTTSGQYTKRAEVGISTMASNANDGLVITGNAAGNVINGVGLLLDMDNSTDNAAGTMRLQRTAGSLFIGFEIGSDSRDGIRFGTINSTGSIENATTERMRITATGDVGIATTTPGSLLSIQSVGNFSAGTSTLYSELRLPVIHATSTTATSTFGGGISTARLSSSGTISAAGSGTFGEVVTNSLTAPSGTLTITGDISAANSEASFGPLDTTSLTTQDLTVTGSGVTFSGLAVADGNEETICMDAATDQLVRIAGGGLCTPSSARFKHDIQKLNIESREMLAKIDPSSFIYNEDVDEKTRWGIIAENLAEVDPHLVTYDKEGKPYAPDIYAIIALIFDNIQEIWDKLTDHDERIEELEKQNTELIERIENLEKGEVKVKEENVCRL
jgi:hypothetical protein